MIELEKVYSKMKHCETISAQIRLSVLLATHNIFAYLASHPALATKISDVKHPNLTAYKTSKGFYDFKHLKLSSRTLRSTGINWLSYILMRNVSSSVANGYRGINHMMNGKTYMQGYLRVRLINLIQFASDLQIPVEAMLYGTTDVQKVARFNHQHYDKLPRLVRQYVMLQMRHRHIVAKLLNSAKADGESDRKISRQIGISYQSVFNYLHDKSWFLSHQSTFDALCRISGQNPCQAMKCSLVPRTLLLTLSRQYARQYK